MNLNYALIRQTIAAYLSVESYTAVNCDISETAMNIGYSCNMLRDDMNEVFVISGLTLLAVQQQLR